VTNLNASEGCSILGGMNIADALKALDRNDWNGAHQIVQDMDTPLAAWFHGVLHMIEGDESNAKYWYRRAGRPFPGKARQDEELQAIRNTAAGD
jgi:hypothetical protein